MEEKKMKATKNGLEVEGTPQEIKELFFAPQETPKVTVACNLSEPRKYNTRKIVAAKKYAKSSHRIWTKKEDDIRLKMYKLGNSTKQIVRKIKKETGITRSAGSVNSRNWEVKRKIPAETIVVTKKTRIRGRTQSSGKTWTDKEDKILVKLRREKKSSKQIGRAIKKETGRIRTQSAILGRVFIKGI